MVGADAYLVFGANHAVGFDAAQLGAFDGEGLVAVVELGSEGGDDDFLSGGDVGCAADYLDGVFTGGEADGADVHVVGIGVGLAGEDFADDESVEASFDGFDGFDAACFQPDGGERGGYFVGVEVEVDVFFQPVVRDVHIVVF